MKSLATTGASSPLPLLPHGIPPIGIGTYELRGDDCVTAVRAALQMGYRLIDTAAVYRNEELVAQGIQSSGVPREDIFIVVKIAMKSMGSDEAVRGGILDSLRKLQTEYADAVLLHWPGCGGLKPNDAAGHHAARHRCWRVMKQLQLEGRVRRMGVSNFLPRHFTELGCFPDSVAEAGMVTCSSGKEEAMAEAEKRRRVEVAHTEVMALGSGGDAPSMLPVVNQIELHPLCIQDDVDHFCVECHGMVLQSYSPLGKGDARLLQHAGLCAVHAKYFESASYSLRDLLIQWGLMRGYSVLVRSHKVAHLWQNLEAAIDYFASVAHQDGVPPQHGNRQRPLLTKEQLEVVRNLRRHMGVEGETTVADLHLCWYSSEIA